MKGSTAVDDQLQAVAAHTSQALEAVLGPGRARELDNLPDLVHDHPSLLYEAKERGRMQVCQHLASPTPGVVFGEQPDVLRCGACAFEDGADRRCSPCGSEAGPNAARNVFPYESLCSPSTAVHPVKWRADALQDTF
ncbi:hypothetical protein ACFVYD_34515 [Streptomyces sp. NPDC058301]|uniref:hypothetical protein n=1 Tax=Streptomyces sp. NPDC058301 TaxID=3346436 RepID=UPI0036EAC2C3